MGSHKCTERLDANIEKMCAEYVAGASSYALGKKYGVSAHTIRRRLEAKRVQRRARGGGHRKPGGSLFVDRYVLTHDRSKRKCYIHRGCWEAYHGRIPGGLDIHHVDGDRLNNEIENLACLTRSEHMTLHREGAV